MSVFNLRALFSTIVPGAMVSIAVLASSGQAFAQASAPTGDAKPKPSVKPAAQPATPTHPAAHPATSAKPAAKPANPKRGAKPAPVAVVEPPLPPADPDQIAAAEKIYYGVHDCEFKQTMDVSIDAKHAGYVDVKFDKKQWVMKPVLSSTGALRLEDVKNTAIVIQIAQKSMLLNTVTGQRLVDECISSTQRELAEAAKKAAAEGAAALAAAPTVSPAASGAK